MNHLSSWVIRGLLLLAAVVCSGFILATSSSEQCGDLTSQEESPIIIRNIGIKMCHVKCVETAGCLTFDYDIDTLTCRLRVGKSNGMEKKGFKTSLKTPSDVPPSPCNGKSCSLGARCLESRSGKAVCVKAGLTFHPVRSQQRRDKKRRKGENLFHQACREGDLCRVRDIFSKAESFLNRFEWENGRTPVMLAARGGHIDVFDFLVNKGCNMSHLDNHGNNILHMSCYGGQVAIVKDVLHLVPIDINSRGQNGRTCLMTAAYRGKRELFEFLVKRGCSVSMGDKDGNNILHLACKGGQIEMVKYIISQGLVDINSRGQDRKTVLMFATEQGYRRIFDFCVSAGCNVSAVDGEGDNILHLAHRAENLQMVKYLISRNLTNINSRGSNGWTSVMLAAMFGQIEIFDFIMSKGGDASAVDDEDRNILHLASHQGNMKMAKHIVSKHFVDVNAKTKGGETAAEIAKEQFYRELSDFLISQGRQGE